MPFGHVHGVRGGGGGGGGGPLGLRPKKGFFTAAIASLGILCSIYAFTKLQAAASDDERWEALALLLFGMSISFMLLFHLCTQHEIKKRRAREIIRREMAAKEARAPCDKVRSKLIKNVMGRIVHVPRDDGGRNRHFAMFDLSNDGKISKAEFISGVQALGVDLEDSELQDCFRMLDKDQSGWLSPKEFAVFLASGSKRFLARLPNEQGPKVELPKNGKDRGKSKDRGNTDPSSTDLPGMVAKNVEA